MERSQTLRINPWPIKFCVFYCSVNKLSIFFSSISSPSGLCVLLTYVLILNKDACTWSDKAHPLQYQEKLRNNPKSLATEKEYNKVNVKEVYVLINYYNSFRAGHNFLMMKHLHSPTSP
jgi:hypothetical protein